MTPTAQALAEKLANIGELIRTQDNRITAHPIFVVEQKRRICGVEADYAEGRLWYDPRACESYDDDGKAERDAEREADGSRPIEWREGFYVDTWEFVTACFTEQGCKDYLASNGHNLREPRIYVHSAFRNDEWQKLREYLAQLGGGREVVAFRFLSEIAAGRYAWSRWFGIDELVHYGEDGNLREGPHPDWTKIEYAYAAPTEPAQAGRDATSEQTP